MLWHIEISGSRRKESVLVKSMHHRLAHRSLWLGNGSMTAAALLLVASGVLVSAAQAADNLSIIPQPMTVKPGHGSFSLSDGVTIVGDDNPDRLAGIGRFLQNALERDAGLRLAVDETRSASRTNDTVRLTIVPGREDLGPEGYDLLVTPESVVIRGATPTGVFWGTQSLLQMVTLQLIGKNAASRKEVIDLPAVQIIDRPRFAWRGLMIDCSRTFLTVEHLRRLVDTCALYKLNVLQLHLTDDQGWRLEIRKHPRLTEVGARFDPRFPGEISGYYTQREIRELVQYAAQRCVTLVPEIEMPGHCLSLLAAYPELACRGDRDKYVIAPYLFMSDGSPDKEPATPYGALCVGNEKTFRVVEDVLEEVIDLFPSEYIHIGGDECAKGFWQACPKCQARMKTEGLKDEEELQSYFIKRVEKMILARGRKLVGWDEILEGGLPPRAVVMSWRGMDGGIAAAGMGHPVVMSPKSHIYFDYCYNRTSAHLVYSFEPIPPELSSEQRSLVLGAEACMWTHLARTEPGIDMMIFPRLLALAEVVWTSTDRRQWDSFSARMKLHEPLLRARGVTCFARNQGAPLPNLSAGQDGRLWLVNSAGEIHLRRNDGWERFPGQARQVTSGPDGSVWSVSRQPSAGGYVLMQWSGRAWKPIGHDAAAVQISAAADGSLWTVSDAYAIWRYAGGQWANVIGLAREVTADPEGTVWILTADPAPGGFQLHYARNSRWRRAEPLMAGARIAAGPSDQLWLIDDDGQLHHWAEGNWRDRPGRVSQLTVGKDGIAWALADDPKAKNGRLLKWAGQDWENLGHIPRP